MRLTLVITALVSLPLTQAATYSLFYSFGCGADGAYSFAGLVIDGAGNLYGTTSRGGTRGRGTVFKLSSQAVETVLHSFPSSPTDGYYPADNVVLDAAGNVYGTTSYGGAYGAGTIFEISAGGAESILYSFTGGADGGNPNGLIGTALATKPQFYGTTYSGGAFGYGTVFRFAPGATETVLHSFSNTTADGGYPFAGVVLGSTGDLYGTTSTGGNFGFGTIFKLSSTGLETVIHSFSGRPTDGATPAAGLFQDSKGNLYGTTSFGGASDKGAVFEWSAAGNETLLQSFTGTTGTGLGSQPGAGLIGDSRGNLYGSTLVGGGLQGCNGAGCGLIFELAPGGTETVLHSFLSPPGDGHFSYSTLLRDTSGNIYGTTYIGGPSRCGAVFKYTP